MRQRKDKINAKISGNKTKNVHINFMDFSAFFISKIKHSSISLIKLLHMFLVLIL